MLNKKDSHTGFCIFLAQDFLMCSASNPLNPWRQKKYVHTIDTPYVPLLSYSILGKSLTLDVVVRNGRMTFEKTKENLSLIISFLLPLRKTKKGLASRPPKRQDNACFCEISENLLWTFVYKNSCKCPPQCKK